MGLFSGIGDFLGGENTQSLGKTANQMLVNVNTPGASSKFDPSSNTITSTLNPQHQAFQNQLFNIGNNLLNQFNSTNFGQVAQDQYNLLSGIGADNRSLQQQSLENRLFNQGLLGTTAGFNQQRALQDSFANADLNKLIAAQQFANQQQNTLFNQGLQSLNGISTLDSIGLQPLAFMNLGAGRANLLAGARNNSNDIGAGLFNSLIGSAESFAGGGMGGAGGSGAGVGSGFDMAFGSPSGGMFF